MMGIFWVFISVLGVGTGLGLFAITRRGDGSDRAREILAERLARGDITPEEFRERLEALGPPVRSRWGALIGAAIALIVVGLIGGFVTAATGGVNPIRSMMGGGMGPMMDGGMGSMMGGETRRLGPSPQPDADEMRVVAGDLFFRPRELRLRAGETVNVALRNDGMMFHTFTVGEVGFALQAQGGDRVSGALRITEPGTYEAICTVPGHADAGMRARVIVGT